MQLNGQQRDQLRKILLDAFSTHLSLETLISDYLDGNIDTEGTSLDRVIFNLIREYNRLNTIETLIQAARKANPTHEKLRDFSVELGLDPPYSYTPIPIPPDDASLSNSPPKLDTYDVFISYCKEDRPWVQNYLVPHLRNANLEVLIDYDGFLNDESILENIGQATLSSRKTIAVLSPDYLKSHWSKLEITFAITHSMNADNPNALITVLYNDWDYKTIPPHLSYLPWLNFTKAEENEHLMKKLIATIKGEKLPPWPNPPYHVVPLDTNLPLHATPAGLTVPPGYRYLGQRLDLAGDLFYRMQDKHVAVRFPGRDGHPLPFLIDKYAITNLQFCTFLNDLLAKKRASIATLASRVKVTCCNDNEGHLLAADADGYWRERQKITRPWGITYIDAKWQPLADCALLPATLVSWQGAHLYSLWVHHLLEDLSPPSCLPTAQQWNDAAQFNPANGAMLTYPWGDTWQRANVHSVGNPLTGEIHPLPVSSLERGHSPIGCVQLAGNTWEWCADSPPGQPERHKIKGGACNSPQEHCISSFDDSTIDMTEYIGFRCSFSLLD